MIIYVDGFVYNNFSQLQLVVTHSIFPYCDFRLGYQVFYFTFLKKIRQKSNFPYLCVLLFLDA